MSIPACSDADFMRLVREVGTRETAVRLGIAERNVYARRKRLERRLGELIHGPTLRGRSRGAPNPARIHLTIPNGIVLVGSDAHIWPGPLTTAMRAFIRFCKTMKPRAVVLNGDVNDFPSISRHPHGWENWPTVQEEIEAAQDALHQIEMAARGAERIWTLGNHDDRFEKRIASLAPEFAKVAGIHLKDHFPNWRPAMACWINDAVVIKHNYKGGIHAALNNTLWAGKSVGTGHTHRLGVVALTDYNGSRFGFETGCLADPNAPQFEYAGDNPKNQRSGFVALTFREGRLMWPEVVHVLDEDHVEFRSEVIKV